MEIANSRDDAAHAHIALPNRRYETSAEFRVGKIPRQNASDRARANQARGQLQILADPDPLRWRDRMHAAAILAHMQPDRELAETAADTLSAVLEDAVPGDDRDQREASLHRWLLIGLPLGAVACIWLVALLSSLFDTEWVSLWLDMGVAASLTACVVGAPLIRALLLDLEDYRVRRLQRTVVHVLCHLKAPRSVGALALALRRYPRLRSRVEAAFASAVTGLTPEHYGTLPPNAVQHLCTLLVCGIGSETAEWNCLLALERVGSGRAIPDVAFVAAKGRTAKLRAAAAAALPVLEQRRRLETDHKLLLRGADSPSLDPFMLLRSGPGTERPAEMLRPVGPQPDADTALLVRSHLPSQTARK